MCISFDRGLICNLCGSLASYVYNYFQKCWDRLPKYWFLTQTLYHRAPFSVLCPKYMDILFANVLAFRNQHWLERGGVKMCANHQCSSAQAVVMQCLTCSNNSLELMHRYIIYSCSCLHKISHAAVYRSTHAERDAADKFNDRIKFICF